MFAQAAAAPPPQGHADVDLGDAVAGCLAKGNACLAHCLALLGSGDTSMAGCAHAVYQMHAVMQGLAAVQAAHGDRLAELARVASGFCGDCEAECRKHEAQHLVCKECAEACARTVAACRKYLT